MKGQKLIGLFGEIQTGNLRNTSWNRYWSARFPFKTVCWRTYIVHAVYKLLVYFRERRHLWSWHNTRNWFRRFWIYRCASF